MKWNNNRELTSEEMEILYTCLLFGRYGFKEDHRKKLDDLVMHVSIERHEQQVISDKMRELQERERTAISYPRKRGKWMGKKKVS